MLVQSYTTEVSGAIALWYVKMYRFATKVSVWLPLAWGDLVTALCAFSSLPESHPCDRPLQTGNHILNSSPLATRSEQTVSSKNLAATFTSSRIETRPNWAEVSLSALRHNFRVLQNHVGADVTICAVVKCNAYGHGVEECAPALEQAGAKWFGVTSTDEGVLLREAGVTGRILVMCGLYAGEEEDALRHHLTPAVFRIEDAQAVARTAARLGLTGKVPIHLKIDTGMARLGLPFADVESFAEGVKRLPEVEVEGTFSHLASSEVLDDEGTRRQIGRFEAALRVLAAHGLGPSCAISRTVAPWGLVPIPGTTSCGLGWRSTDTSSPPAIVMARR